MPVYILHGFRWPRAGFTGIRVHIILQNIDDAAPEYIQGRQTERAILKNFREAFPDILEHLPNLRLIEQYDPDDVSEAAVSQPYAYVADKVVTLADSEVSYEENQPPDPLIGHKNGVKIPYTGGGLSANVEDVTAAGTGLTARGWEAMADLRDKIAAGENIGWWVVYNGDPERWFDGKDDDVIEEEDEEEGEGEEQAEDDEGDEEVMETTPQPLPKKSAPSRVLEKKPLPTAPPVVSLTL